MKFEDIINNDKIFLYYGDMEKQRRDYTNIPFIGLSLKKQDQFHTKHDVTQTLPLKDNTVDIIQSEDVMEHIEYEMLKNLLMIYFRVLKPEDSFVYQCLTISVIFYIIVLKKIVMEILYLIKEVVVNMIELIKK